MLLKSLLFSAAVFHSEDRDYDLVFLTLSSTRLVFSFCFTCQLPVTAVSAFQQQSL
jgi:hypothetical protein